MPQPVGPVGPVLQTTKLHPPAVRSTAVRRSRLTDLLGDARPALALLVAPPGFGKTTLLAQWAEADPRPFAWVRLDSQDNDRTVLWTYIAAAVASAAGRDGALDRFTTMARRADPAGALANEIDGLGTDLVLVLDDYYLIKSDECHATIARFIELAPSAAQLVVATRWDPPLNIARLRATGELVELRAGDLQFNPDETRQFLNDSLALGLDRRAVSILHERTEGWPAGLYLAYLSLRESADPREFVQTFGASNRHVIDYLTEQVVMALGADVMQFMLATSIVDTICGPLADVLTGEAGSAQRLVDLERANVFIAPLDERREWYRYHPLLAELLRTELARREPDRLPVLHHRAADWYEAAGDTEHAIAHAIAAGDLDLASRLIGQNYLREIEWGRIATVIGWLDAIGPTAVAADRRLGVVKAWTMHFIGRHAEADAALLSAIEASDTGPLPDGASSIEATAALIGAAFPGADVGAMLAAAHRAFDLEASRASPWRVTVHTQLGFALVRSGQFEQARQPLQVGADLASSSGLWMDAVGSRTLLSRVELEIGDPARAERLAREAIDLADSHDLTPTPTAAYARATLGAVLVRRGDVTAGESMLTESMGPIRAFGEPLSMAEVLLPLAAARRALGRRAEAKAALDEANEIIDRAPDPGVLGVGRSRGAIPKPVPGTEALTTREVEVILAVSNGVSNREAARRLFVSYNTVHSHLRTIYRKLDVTSRTAAIERARERGLIK
jgi:LuxR family maltose regulon positive regulatory protein